MKSRLIFLLSFIYFLNVSTVNGQWLSSICPKYFQYDQDEIVGNTWNGTIKFTADFEYSGIWLRVLFDKPVLEMTSNFGEVVQREPAEYLIKKSNQKIEAGEIVFIHIYVRFGFGEKPPQLIGFRLNGRTICPETELINNLTSPCPETFNYESSPNENDRWYGTIQLKSAQELNGVWLRVILDKPSLQLGVSQENWFGAVTTEDNKEYLIKNRNQKVRPGEAIPVRFFVKYNSSEPVPRLKEYRLNAIKVCPKENVSPVESEISSTSYNNVPEVTTSSNFVVRPTTDSEIFRSDFDPNSKPSFLPPRERVPSVPARYPCGEVAAQPRPLITYGENTTEGQWPWHAALYYPKGIDLQYICGASLISLNHVLTAAHCVSSRSSNTPVKVDDIQVFLGKYNLRKFADKNIQSSQVSNIIVHPEYNHRYYANDIAIVKLANPVSYTDHVRPVCLWSENRDISNIVDKEGTVVGWGCTVCNYNKKKERYDQTGKVTETLTKAKMPVVSQQKCIWSYPEFFLKFTNDKTFCAGFRNGTSVCNGDSGGGLVFPKINSNPSVWHIRGVVSLSVALQSEIICDTTHYAIFTDVAKYLDWIQQNIS